MHFDSAQCDSSNTILILSIVRLSGVEAFIIFFNTKTFYILQNSESHSENL